MKDRKLELLTEKGVEVPPTRAGSDAWVARQSAIWSPIGAALAHAGHGLTPELEAAEARLEDFEAAQENPGQPCGPRCWHARSAVCHCSCNGQNHGRDRAPIARALKGQP